MKQAQLQTIRSYLSAIRATLQNLGIKLNEDIFLLNSLTKACRLKNDSFCLWLPIQKQLLLMVLDITEEFYQDQEYLSILYKTLFATAYFGLFRVSELTMGSHAISVVDVHMGQNKEKVLFILQSSKTHGHYAKPQQVKISSKPAGSEWKGETRHCPFFLLRAYITVRPKYRSPSEPFFIFRDFSPVSAMQMRDTLRLMLKVGGFSHLSYCTQSLRSGRACDLLDYGLSVETIKKLGRWKSNAVYTYLK